MNGEQNPKNLIDTTDCLEAVGVFKGWKNGLFFFVLCILFLLQISFWLVHSGLVRSATCETEAQSAISQEIQEAPPAVVAIAPDDETDTIASAAKKAASDPNKPAACILENKEPEQAKTKLLNITTDHLSWLIRFLNFLLIITAVLYCLTMLFILKVSLQGRMGGINHITRAFFLSILMLVLLLPWQKFFNGVIAGVMYTPSELVAACENFGFSEILDKVLFYLRFCFFWLVVVLLLIMSQVRSVRWARATLRRLDVI
ncbi:MAG: hypothetical protein ACYTE8_10490 [Planctomycetota bacterium]|jgi:hypothetical protein